MASVSELGPRLEACFAAVFPGLSVDQIRSAGADHTAAWDSTAMFTLVAVVEEEFGCKIGDDDVAGLVSYSAFLELLQSRTP